MRILGIGVDIVQLSRFEALLTRPGGLHSRFTSRLIGRILHASERQQFEALAAQKSVQQCVRFVLGSWAAKEAVFKTLDRQDQRTFQFKDWYRYKLDGKPCIGSDVYARSDEFLLSVSHDGGVLVANVLRQQINKQTQTTKLA